MADRPFTIFIVAALAGLLFDCTRSVSGVETTNGDEFTVTATSNAIEGKAPPMSRVYVFDSWYIPYIDSGVGLGTSADEEGNYRIPADSGGYNVMVVDVYGQRAGIAGEIVAPGQTTAGTAPPHRLQQTGSITGSVASSGSGPLLVYLAGMIQYQLVNGERDFLFTSVPPGSYHLNIARLPGADAPFAVLFDSVVTVTPGEAVRVGEVRPR